ncbi:unnamed protein product [Schistocephalus solidus]|uniref:G_PROTEIN_RECEP_F1_2 domain-containing protein n=1 Tax=Schistocephalus solidus TaxID=70667 RepID=A0A183SFH7_SCHSO|nr:unnamed protein product [Schistocephalus solidus]
MNRFLSVFHLGVPLCDFWMVMDVFFCTASILHLVGIAVDRYRAVSSVEYVRRGDKRPIFVTILLVWVVAAGISLPGRFALSRGKELTQEVDVEGHCAINAEYSFTIISTVGAFFLPMIFLIGIYAKIYVVAMKRIRKKNFRRHHQVASGPASRSMCKDISIELSIRIQAESTSPSSTYRHQNLQQINAPLVNPADVREHASRIFTCASALPPPSPTGEKTLTSSELDHPEDALKRREYCKRGDFLRSEQRLRNGSFEHPASVLSYTCGGSELVSPILGMHSSQQSVFWLPEGPTFTPPLPVAPSLALIQSPHVPFPSSAHSYPQDITAVLFGKEINDTSNQKKEVPAQKDVRLNFFNRKLPPVEDSLLCINHSFTRGFEDKLHRQTACDFGPLPTEVTLNLHEWPLVMTGTTGDVIRINDKAPAQQSVSRKHLPEPNGYIKTTKIGKRRFCRISDSRGPNNLNTMVRGLRRAKSLSNYSRFSTFSNGVTSIQKRIKTWKSADTSRGEAIPRKERLEHTRERKAARTLAIITGCFILCWLPFSMNALIRPFCGERCDAPRSVNSFLLWLGYMNSMLNPIIYTIFSPDFRSAFSKIISCRYRSCDTCICM